MEVDAASTERVAILDAGAQYGKVIDRRVRELNVESVLLPLDTAAYTLKEAVSGGWQGLAGDHHHHYHHHHHHLEVADTLLSRATEGSSSPGALTPSTATTPRDMTPISSGSTFLC